MTESRRVVTITYAGQTSGTGPLSLGQDNMIRCTLNNEPADINKQGAWPVPENADVDDVLSALQTLTERHESLRTLYPSTDGRQPTEQHVQAEGTFNLEIIDTDEDPAEVAGRIGRRNRATRFDVATEFPLRLALITVEGAPKTLSAVVCHAAADGGATARLVEEFIALASGIALPPHEGLTPRQVAELETSSAGIRRTKASLQHWDKILRTGPHAVFADSSVGPSEAIHRSLAVHSVSAAQALDEASRRMSASSSAIMLAAYAALIAHRAAQKGLVIAALSSNRHRRVLADHIGTVAQDALILLDTDAKDFDELVGRAGGAAMTAYFHSSFDAAAVWDLIDEAARQRGARYARHVVLNDLSTTIPEVLTRDLPEPPEDPQIISLPPEPIPTRLMFNIWQLAGRVSFTLHADQQLFDAAEIDLFARGLLGLVQEAATRAVPLSEIGELTGLAPRPRDGEWRFVGNSWIDLGAVRELLETSLDKRPVSVEVQDDQLVAHIGDDHRPLSPEDAHRAVTHTLFDRQRGVVADDGDPDEPAGWISSSTSGWETAMTPQHYVIHSGTPTDSDDGQDAWASLPIVAEGDGRD